METIDIDRSQFAKNIVTMYAIKSGLTHWFLIMLLGFGVFLSPYLRGEGIFNWYLLCLVFAGGVGAFFIRGTKKSLLGEMSKLFPDKKRLDNQWVDKTIRRIRITTMAIAQLVLMFGILSLMMDDDKRAIHVAMVVLAGAVLFFIELDTFVKEIANRRNV